MAPIHCVVLSVLEWRNHCGCCQKGGQKAEREGQATDSSGTEQPILLFHYTQAVT